MTENWIVTIKTDNTLTDLQRFVHVWAEIYDSAGLLKGAISFTRDVPVSL